MDMIAATPVEEYAEVEYRLKKHDSGYADWEDVGDNKNVTIENRPRDSTCFLDLPAEIRNVIYEQSIIESKPINICQCDFRLQVPSLLMTSRQIRTEVLPLYYSLNTFKACTSACTDKWLTRLTRHQVSLLCNLQAFGQSPGITEFLKYAKKFTHFWVSKHGGVDGPGDGLRKRAVLVPLRTSYLGRWADNSCEWVRATELDKYETMGCGGAEWFRIRDDDKASLPSMSSLEMQDAGL